MCEPEIDMDGRRFMHIPTAEEEAAYQQYLLDLEEDYRKGILPNPAYDWDTRESEGTADA